MFRSAINSAVVTSLAFSAHMALAASPLLHGIPLRGAERLTRSAAAGECVDFSGVWRGVCVANEVRFEVDRMQADQFGCDLIVFDGDALPVGGMTTTTTTIPAGEQLPGSVASDNISADWNDDRSELLIQMSLLTRVLNDVSSTISVSGSGKYWIEDSKLRQTFESTGASPISVECSFDKLPEVQAAR